MGHDRMIACGDNRCWCYAHQEMLSALEQRISGMTDSRKIIEASLKIAVEYYQADRAFILDIDDELDVGCNTYEYSAMALTQNGVSFGLSRWNFFQSGMRPYIAADRSS